MSAAEVIDRLRTRLKDTPPGESRAADDIRQLLAERDLLKIQNEELLLRAEMDRLRIENTKTSYDEAIAALANILGAIERERDLMRTFENRHIKQAADQLHAGLTGERIHAQAVLKKAGRR